MTHKMSFVQAHPTTSRQYIEYDDDSTNSECNYWLIIPPGHPSIHPSTRNGSAMRGKVNWVPHESQCLLHLLLYCCCAAPFLLGSSINQILFLIVGGLWWLSFSFSVCLAVYLPMTMTDHPPYIYHSHSWAQRLFFFLSPKLAIRDAPKIWSVDWRSIKWMIGSL